MSGLPAAMGGGGYRKRHYGVAIRLLRRVLWNAQGGICGICGAPVPARFGSPKLSLEHVYPWSKTRRDIGNLLLAHARCNAEKGDRSPTGCERIMLALVNAKLGIPA